MAPQFTICMYYSKLVYLYTPSVSILTYCTHTAYLRITYTACGPSYHTVYNTYWSIRTLMCAMHPGDMLQHKLYIVLQLSIKTLCCTYVEILGGSMHRTDVKLSVITRLVRAVDVTHLLIAKCFFPHYISINACMCGYTWNISNGTLVSRCVSCVGN